MTEIKICGLTRLEDINNVNLLMPEYAGFVFYKKSRRYVGGKQAAALRRALSAKIRAVGVFVDDDPGMIADLVSEGIIDMIQLHGFEDDKYIETLRHFTDAQIIKAFLIHDDNDLKKAETCTSDHILLDAGKGDGKTFDWSILKDIKRPYFLAGGLNPQNVSGAVISLDPFAVDVSSGVETDGIKDPVKMKAFVNAVRRGKENG
ncbi:MAG: phosphoribosylanthranilate isomerase [Lachnospiraceae bacterium]|nr:phosphoribosylanthranilate isomerase [Lachnospiraceae bacterium]